MTYVLQNGDSTKIASVLSEMYRDVSASIVAYKQKNQLIVLGSETTHEQIKLMLKYMDRAGTEYIDSPEAVIDETPAIPGSE